MRALVPGLALRPAVARDFGFCEHLSRANMAGYLQARGIAWEPARFRASWEAFENLMIVVGDERTGVLRLLPEDGALGLRDLQIVPVWQRQGVGGWAVRQAQDIAMQRGHPQLRLRVYAENPARALYARLGFMVESQAEGTVHMVWDGRVAGPGQANALPGDHHAQP